jgi:RNA polymerase sigma-70 factor (ECF subfamily)
LSIALLLTLDRPVAARAGAFLLHDVFDFSFSEVASGTGAERGCVPAACRPRTRARARSAATRPRPRRRRVQGEIDAKHAQLLSAFAAATQSGDLMH